jgi:LysM repeat protein
MPVVEGERSKVAAGRRLRPTRRRPMAVAATQRAPLSRRSARLWLAGALVGVAMIAVRVSSSDRTIAPESVTTLEARSATEDQGDAAPQLGVGLADEAPYAGIAVPPPTPIPGRLQPTSYQVRDGDTLLEIAERFGLRSETLLWANSLPNPDLIVVGQELVVPPLDGILYQLEAGDRLGDVVARYGLELDRVVTVNDIQDANDVQVGTSLILPGARPVAPSRVVNPGPNTTPDQTTTPDSAALAAQVLQLPLPDNVSELLATSWVRTLAPNALFSSPSPGARRHTNLPADARLERTGDLAGRRIPVRDPGDGRTRQAMSGWIDIDALEPTRAPGPRELPRAYPDDTRMDIAHNFVPYRGQLDGSPYAEANCGPTSIGMVLESFGLPASLASLRAEVLDAQQMWGNSTGTLLTALAQVVEDHGLKTYGLREDGAIRRWSLDDVRAQLRQRRPVVAQARYRALPGREGSYYRGDHYIVITGVLDDGFLYNDPIDFDGPGWDRVISGERLERAMDASDARYAYAAFAAGT